jgi:hypothetical protein
VNCSNLSRVTGHSPPLFIDPEDRGRKIPPKYHATFTATERRQIQKTLIFNYLNIPLAFEQFYRQLNR